jgi:hypothetical protein
MTFIEEAQLSKYLMGLCQGNIGAPSSSTKLSLVIMHVFRGLDCGAMIMDPVTKKVIHPVGSMVVDDADLYCWAESPKRNREALAKIQEETNTWENILITTGSYL